MTSPSILSAAQVESFIEFGYTKVEEAFPRDKALAARNFVWDKLESHGVRRDDKATWKPPVYFLMESYNEPIFQECFTPRLRDAVEDIVGKGRWKGYNDEKMDWGWWPVNFSLDAGKPWDVPADDWHWDGNFIHTVDCPHQGILLICIFSEIGPRSGGTLLVEGSHQIVARLLNQHPEGIKNNTGFEQIKSTHPWLRQLTDRDSAFQPGSQRVERLMQTRTSDSDGTSLRVVETSGSPGDIYLCHPFILHSRSPNHSGQPRFMCNPPTPLREKMNLDRPAGDYSPVETAIRRAIGGK